MFNVPAPSISAPLPPPPNVLYQGGEEDQFCSASQITKRCNAINAITINRRGIGKKKLCPKKRRSSVRRPMK
jgi:hypothetical protein